MPLALISWPARYLCVKVSSSLLLITLSYR